MKAKLSKNQNHPISIRNDLRPGDIGQVVHLHGVVYAEEQGWNHTFDAYVAGPLAEFVKSSTHRDRIWIVELAEGAEERGGKTGRIVGSVAIVNFSESDAQLRWLLLDPRVRGLGIGRRLVEEALDFSRSVGYSFVFLWTVRGLEAATSLYESLGFEKTEEKTSEIWWSIVTEVRYDLLL
jgi:GNAT superfamily N-acetyltransferase